MEANGNLDPPLALLIKNLPPPAPVNQNPSRGFGKQENLVPLPGIEPRSLSHPSGNLTIIDYWLIDLISLYRKYRVFNFLILNPMLLNLNCASQIRHPAAVWEAEPSFLDSSCTKNIAYVSFVGSVPTVRSLTFRNPVVIIDTACCNIKNCVGIFRVIQLRLAINDINKLIFIMDMNHVLCEAGAAVLCSI